MSSPLTTAPRPGGPAAMSPSYPPGSEGAARAVIARLSAEGRLREALAEEDLSRRHLGAAERRLDECAAREAVVRARAEAPLVAARERHESARRLSKRRADAARRLGDTPVPVASDPAVIAAAADLARAMEQAQQGACPDAERAPLEAACQTARERHGRALVAVTAARAELAGLDVPRVGSARSVA